jgi:hypothetical protein
MLASHSENELKWLQIKQNKLNNRVLEAESQVLNIILSFLKPNQEILSDTLEDKVSKEINNDKAKQWTRLVVRNNPMFSCNKLLVIKRLK